MTGRKRRRSRHRAAPLPLMFIWVGLSLDLAGLYFDCLSDEHMAGMCYTKTVCVRCRRPGHITHECRAPHSRSPPRPAVVPPHAGRAPARDHLGPCVTPPPSSSPTPSSSYHTPAASFVQRATPVHARLGPIGMTATRAPSELARQDLGIGGRQDAPVHACLGPVAPSACKEPSESPSGARRPAVEAVRVGRPGSPSLRPDVERCVIPRSEEVVAVEDTIRWSLVAITTGGHPRVTIDRVVKAIKAALPRVVGSVSVHHFWLTDFLLVLDSRASWDELLGASEVSGRGFSLRLSPWNHYLQATHRPFHYWVRVGMGGITRHVWSRATA
ncbi:hypothetical protein D1007_32169 [Hordeum vulgare]|nr:hypothetical protein D1007_32169 [Hordeum vulgare]